MIFLRILVASDYSTVPTNLSQHLHREAVNLDNQLGSYTMVPSVRAQASTEEASASITHIQVRQVVIKT